MSGGMEVIPLMLIGMAAEVIAARMAMGQQEAVKRNDAEHVFRQQHLEALRTRYTMEMRDAFVQLQDRDSLLADDYTRLKQRCDDLLAAFDRAPSDQEMHQAARAIPFLMIDLNDSLLRKRIYAPDVPKPKTDAAHDRFILLEQRLALISEAEAAHYDPTGRQAAERALANAKEALLQPASPITEGALAHAAQCVQSHFERVAEMQAQRREQQAQAEHAVAEMHALIAGMKADPVVTRWHAQGLAELETQAQEAEQAATSGTFDSPVSILHAARERAKQIVAEANQSQLHADQRDYIASSIARSLGDMGFVVEEPVSEHPEHPATSKIIRAATSAGQGVAVSVPTEGPIWYDTSGYIETTEATVGGGTAVVCDEAEAVLEEMHARLESAFGVKMSEIVWPGKDPNRKLRKADQLPKSGAPQRQESVR